MTRAGFDYVQAYMQGSTASNARFSRHTLAVFAHAANHSAYTGTNFGFEYSNCNGSRTQPLVVAVAGLSSPSLPSLRVRPEIGFHYAVLKGSADDQFDNRRRCGEMQQPSNNAPSEGNLMDHIPNLFSTFFVI